MKNHVLNSQQVSSESFSSCSTANHGLEKRCEDAIELQITQCSSTVVLGNAHTGIIGTMPLWATSLGWLRRPGADIS